MMTTIRYLLDSGVRSPLTLPLLLLAALLWLVVGFGLNVSSLDGAVAAAASGGVDGVRHRHGIHGRHLLLRLSFGWMKERECRK